MYFGSLFCQLNRLVVNIPVEYFPLSLFPIRSNANGSYSQRQLSHSFRSVSTISGQSRDGCIEDQVLVKYSVRAMLATQFIPKKEENKQTDPTNTCRLPS